MKKIVLTIIVLSSLTMAGGSKSSTPKYSSIKGETEKRVRVGGGGCHEFIYVTLRVTGEKNSSTKFRNGYATVRTRFGNNSGPCFGRSSYAYVENMTLGQVSYSDSNAFHLGNFNKKNVTSISIDMSNSAASKSHGFLAWALVTVHNRLVNIRATAR